MKFNKIKKVGLYIINVLLFLFLVGFSLKYWNVMVENIKNANKIFIFYSFLCLLAITIIITIRWFYLLKPFNKKKKIKFSDLYYVLNGSNIYKYVPPKGINYLMRLNFAKSRFKGVLTSMFGEFYSEVYFYSLCLLFFILYYFFINIYVFYLVVLFVLIGTIFFVFPRLVIFGLDILRIKFKKIRELIVNFTQLVRSKHYYYSLVFFVVSMLLYGLTFYFLLIAFGLPRLSVFTLVIVFFSAQFISMLFMAPGGLGVRDIGIVALLGMLGMNTASALIVSLMFRAIMFFAELVVGIFCIISLKQEHLNLKDYLKNKDVKGYFNDTAEKFSNMYKKSPAFKERFRVWKKYINKYSVKKKICLDMGCGDGILSVYLAKKGKKVIGIDQSKEMIKIAVKNSKSAGVKCKFICKSISEKFPEYKNKAGMVVCSSVLEYMEEPEKAVGVFYDSLKSGGVLLVTLPNKKSVYRLGERVLKRLGLFKKSYIHFQKNQYSLDEAKQLFLGNGFKFVESEYFAIHSILYRILPRFKNKYISTQMILVFKK